MSERPLELAFPFGGVDRAVALQRQPPYRTRDALNALPRDVLAQRRGGRRPGMGNIGISSVSGPVRMLENLTYQANRDADVASDGTTFTHWGDAYEQFTDDFAGYLLNGVWQAESWLYADLPTTFKDSCAIVPSGAAIGGTIKYSNELQIHPKQPWCLDLLLLPENDTLQGLFGLYCTLKRSGATDHYLDPSISGSEGFKLEVYLDGNRNYSGILYYRCGVTTYSNVVSLGQLPAIGPLLFQLRVTPNSSGTTYSYNARLNQNTLLSADGTGGWNLTRGVGFKVNNLGSNRILLDRFRVRHVKKVTADSSLNPDQQPRQRRIFVISGGGKLYYESMVGNREPIRNSAGNDVGAFLRSDRNINATQYQGKLYIANHAEPALLMDVRFASGVALVFSNCFYTRRLTSAELGRIPSNYISDGKAWLTIFFRDAPPANNIEGCWKIAAVDNAHVYDSWKCCKWTLETNGIEWGVGSIAEIVGYNALVSAHVDVPYVYDPVKRGAGLWDSVSRWQARVGSVPIGCPLIATYGDRLVLAGFPPHVWYMPRRGDPDDFNYMAIDPQAAITGTSSDAGRLGEPITALAPWQRDYMIFGCDKSIWVMRGDPCYGGRLDCADHNYGIVDAKSWCYLPDGNLLFLSRDGLRMLSAGDRDSEALSSDRLPGELHNVDTHNWRASMIYDSARKGAWVCLAPVASVETGEQLQWFFDLQDGGFWPIKLPTGRSPSTILTRESDSYGDCELLFGCNDGVVRSFHPGWLTDEGVVIDSYVLYGPFRLWDAEREGILNQMIATLGDASGPVQWSIYVGATAEECYTRAKADASFLDGDWVGGINGIDRPRARGNYAILKVAGSSTSSVPWMIDSVICQILKAGVYRGI